jgi:phosphopantothenoylcysteine decarboxylase/phosphopantothenate--cysteine ligase
MRPLEGKSIVLGVTGSIAAYKAASLASLLVQQGAALEIIMTEAAQQFVRPLTFAAITHASIHTDQFALWSDTSSGHVTLAGSADLLVVAPATAATIARLALGLADDLLGLVALSTSAPLLIAPAMEHRMFHHPATQDHLQTLVRRGATIIGPESGRLASGGVGDGRMTSPEAIASAAREILGSQQMLTGRKIVVTAGGTREPIDPVRYIGNRSSGRMGYAIAQAAIDAGATVTLISGAAIVDAPELAEVITVETALQMQNAVETSTVGADALVMAAAVSDYRSAQPYKRKIKKSEDASALKLHLVQNPDILANLDRPDLLKIGFAAETDDLLKNAREKLTSKHLAMIVANDAESTIGAEDSEATLLFSDGRVLPLPRMDKAALAREITRAVAELLVEADQRAP